MSLRGISGVVLGYFRLDGGAARAREGRGNLFSDFIRGKPIAFLQDIYKARSLYIICILSGVRAWVAHIYKLLILSRLNTFSPL